MVLSTTGGCRADIHSPTHVQCMSRAKYPQGPVDVTWAVLAGREGWRNSPQPRAGYLAPRDSWPGDAMHGGCQADSTTHVQCPGSPCHSQNIRRACGCDMGSAAGREGWCNSPQPRPGHSAGIPPQLLAP